MIRKFAEVGEEGLTVNVAHLQIRESDKRSNGASLITQQDHPRIFKNGAKVTS